MGGLAQARCRFLQEKLLASGVAPGTRIPRRAWDEALCRDLGIGYEQVRLLTRTGDLNGYWIRHPHQGPKQGSIELRARP